jgi:two-component system LytT family response regulator
MIKCMIVDDEQHAIDLLTNHVSKIPWLNLQVSFTRPLDALEFLHQHSIDLIFLDIQMPSLSGIRFLEVLKGKCKVILTTAYSEYALQGYEHAVVDYLLKPIVFERFLAAVEKLANPSRTSSNIVVTNESNDDSYIFVSAEGRSRLVKIVLNDIEYIEALGNYLSIYTNSARIITHITLKELEEQLPATQFVRIHNSYMVPLKKIAAIQGNTVQIGKQTLPVGDIYKRNFLATIDQHVIRTKK